MQSTTVVGGTSRHHRAPTQPADGTARRRTYKLDLQLDDAHDIQQTKRNEPSVKRRHIRRGHNTAKYR